MHLEFFNKLCVNTYRPSASGVQYIVSGDDLTVLSMHETGDDSTVNKVLQY
jgi:hypothetical protein